MSGSPMPDEDPLRRAILTLQVRPRDDGAWATIYAHLQPRFAAMARRVFGRDPDRVEEVVQQAFRDLYLNRVAERVVDADGFLRYAMRTCANAGITIARQHARRERREIDIAPLTEAVEHADATGLQPFSDPEVLETLLDSVLKDLDESDKQLLALLVDGQRDYHAVAAELGISPAAAATRISRLRMRMQKLLSE